MNEEEIALDEVADARTDLLTARDGYLSAVMRARSLGLSNIKIARAAGVTEPAIRAFLKRNEES